MRRFTLAIAAMAGALLLLTTGGAGATASNPPTDRSYLALGDSVVFGYIAGDGNAYGNAANFIGYPDFVGRDLKLTPINASCPGEASGGFQFTSSQAGYNDNGCTPFKANVPLHVNYAGAATQMAFAVNYLKTHPNTRLVTLGLGANDLFILQRSCGADQGCLIAGLGVMAANVGSILSGLRATGYKGVLEVVNYYSLDYGDPAQFGGSQLLNQFETQDAAANGAVIADAFTGMENAAAFAGGHTCLAGLLNAAPGAAPSCDVHPSITGQQSIAQAVEAAYIAAKQAGD